MSDTVVSIAGLLKKTEHYDKDERYMATSDLCEVLKRESDLHGSGGSGSGNNNAGNNNNNNNSNSPSLDASTERQICAAVLTLLHDKSNDVQAIAVKTLGVLLTTVQQEQVLEIADSLTDQVLDASKSELRDVYAIGLRTLVKTIPGAMGHRVSQRLVGRLLDGIRTSDSDSDSGDEIVLACLDILTDLLVRFGSSALSVTRQHEPILQMCLRQLSCESAVVRKRAGNAIGCLSVVLSDVLLMRMVEALLSQIDMAAGVGRAGRRKTRSMHKDKVGTGTGIGSGANDAAAAGAAAGALATAPTAAGDTRALIRTMCTVSGAVGHRLGQAQIDRILPIFLRFTDPEDAVTGDDQDDLVDDNNNGGGGGTSEDQDDMEDIEDEAAVALANELRESCFMGFESFVLRCPTEVEPHLEKIIQAALAYMSYDPNYSYGTTDDEELDGGGGDGDEEEDDEYDVDDGGDDYEDEEEDDDDDDESWKVRRSAIRALKAVVEAKKHDPSPLWTTSFTVRRGKSAIVAAALVGRFKEREENCRVGVIDCFTRFLQVTVAASTAGVVTFASSEDEMDISNSPCIELRSEYAPKLVKACEKIMCVKKGNERSKSSALALLSCLCQAPGGVGGQQEISSVFQHVQTFLAAGTEVELHREGTSKALRLDALSLVHAMLVTDNHDPVHVRQSLRQTLFPELCLAVKEQWYKVIAEALRALASVPRFFVLGYTAEDTEETRAQERAEVGAGLYTAIEPLLAAHDVDQEIKECALTACAAVLSSLHANLTVEQKSRMLALLLDRLNNETTRISAIKTLSSVASASTSALGSSNSMEEDRIDLSPILADSITTMASFLKLQSRSLKQHSLESLGIVVTNHGSCSELADGTLYAAVLQDFAPLIVDDDLHLSHLSLRATVSVLKVCPAAGPAVKAHVLEQALLLSTSSLLQDLALDSLLALLEQMVLSNAVDFDELLSLLRARLDQKVGKHGVYNLAKCIAMITATTTPENRQKVIAETLTLLKGSNTPADDASLRQVQLALLITGDLGRMTDLSTIDGVADELKTIYIEYFESSSEDLKQAAAYALGNASVGSQSTFLPAIVSKLDENNKKQQYLLLSALREFIQCSFKRSGGDGIVASLPVIVPPLQRHAADEEEGVRNMVAECLGSLTCLQPATMLKKLEELQTEHSEITAPGGFMADDDTASTKNAYICWTIASSMKLAIAGKVDPAELAPFMPSFLKLLQKEELSVRNAALLMVYSAAHHMPQVVVGLLKDDIMPSLYEVSKLKLERKVDLGPFTHTVDDGIPLRKAALSIFATFLEQLPGSLDIQSFMPVLALALGDAEDIQLHAHQIVISMCSRQATYLEASVETFVEPLEKTMNKKPGAKTGTELERLNDWIKSALRVMLTLSRLEGAMNSRKFAEFVERVKANSKFIHMVEALELER